VGSRISGRPRGSPPASSSAMICVRVRFEG
jgi:hypothetical protein